MKISQGIYNNHGRVQIRIWPATKAVDPAPYTEGKFGCWCEEHIKQAERRLRALRDDIDAGKFKAKHEARAVKFPEMWDFFFHKHYASNPDRSEDMRIQVRGVGRGFKELWANVYHHEFKPKHVREDFIDRWTGARSSLNTYLGILHAYFARVESWVKLEEIDPVRLPDFNPVLGDLRPKDTKYKGRKHLELGELRAFKTWCLANDPDLWIAAYAATSYGQRKGDMERLAGQSSILGTASKTGKVILLPGQVPLASKLPKFDARWLRARKACSIEWFHWHWWRAMFGKVARWQGIDEKTVQEIYQHSTVAQTREYTGDAEWARPAIDSVRGYLDTL